MALDEAAMLDVVFIRLQKYYVGGVTAGSSKG